MTLVSETYAVCRDGPVGRELAAMKGQRVEDLASGGAQATNGQRRCRFESGGVAGVKAEVQVARPRGAGVALDT